MVEIEKLLEKVRPHYQNGDPGHDVAHILRVMKACKAIGSSEGADLAVLLPAALLHDVVNLPKNHPERLGASAKAAKLAAEILADLGAEPALIGKISDVITEHSYSLGKKPTTIESAVLQDADKLDALGAIGIMRTVTCGCRMGAAYYDLDEPIAKNRPLNDKHFTLDHFYEKLFKLGDLMNTPAGKKEASKRIAFMKSFIWQLQSEID